MCFKSYYPSLDSELCTKESVGLETYFRKSGRRKPYSIK